MLTAFLVRHLPRRFQAAAIPGLRLYSLALRGNAVACPVCGSTFRKFVSYGHLEARKNALCPKCFALERHRLLWLYLRDRTDFFRTPARVLHVAPERCFIKRFRSLLGSGYVTADRDSPQAAVRIDIQDMPFAENTFDVILCNHVLEHVDDDLLAMREIRRVLSPNGWAILQSPIDAELDVTYEDPSITTRAARERAFGQRDHVRRYGRDYGRRLTEAGLRVFPDDFARALPAELVERYAISEAETIFLCRK